MVHRRLSLPTPGQLTVKPLAAMTSGDLRAMLDVKLVAMFNVWHAALLPMREENWGRMIAIASLAGLKGYPYVAGYVAAKHAVVGLTRAMALELAQRRALPSTRSVPGLSIRRCWNARLTTIMDKTGRTRDDSADIAGGRQSARAVHSTERNRSHGAVAVFGRSSLGQWAGARDFGGRGMTDMQVQTRAVEGAEATALWLRILKVSRLIANELRNKLRDQSRDDACRALMSWRRSAPQ